MTTQHEQTIEIDRRAPNAHGSRKTRARRRKSDPPIGTLRRLETSLLGDSAPVSGETLALYAVRSKPEVRRTARTKRAFDLALSLVLIVVLLPLMLVVALLVKLNSSGPVLFRQPRLGKDMRSFSMLKFRTMTADAPVAVHRDYIAQLATDAASNGNGLHKLVDDPRVTPVGAVLRRFSLDELPQLFNVLVGHMSLVGPRPAIGYEVEYYRPEHFSRFVVRPGLTGLWQVSGRSELSFHDMLDLDSQYARCATIVTDVHILALTPRAVVGRTA